MPQLFESATAPIRGLDPDASLVAAASIPAVAAHSVATVSTTIAAGGVASASVIAAPIALGGGALYLMGVSLNNNFEAEQKAQEALSESTAKLNALRKKCKPIQQHHFATNKSKKWTGDFEKIVEKYGLNLNGDWNIDKLPHQGRHTDSYHGWVLKQIQQADSQANGDKGKFLKLFDKYVKDPIRKDPSRMYNM